MSNLALRVPKVKKTKDVSENNRRMRIRACMVKCIDYLCKHPETAVELWTAIEADLISLPASGAGPQGMSLAGSWEGKTTFGKIPADFYAQWFASLPGGPSRQLLDVMDAKDPDCIRDIATMMLQIRRSDSIPKVAYDRQVMSLLFSLRLEQVGPRVPGWFASSVAADGSIDWGKKPLFELDWADDTLKGVKHISGVAAVIPLHMSITKAYKLENPFADTEAAFVLAPARVLLKDLFDGHVGPNQFALDRKGKGLQGLAEKAKAQLDFERGKLQAGSLSSSENAVDPGEPEAAACAGEGEAGSGGEAQEGQDGRPASRAHRGRGGKVSGQ